MRSNRDNDANAKIWKKTATDTENGNVSAQAIAKIYRAISRLERRMPGRIDQSLEYFPFRIYNVQVPAQPATGPTIPAGTQAWQCWQVRSGLAAGRSRYVVDTGNFGDFYVSAEQRKEVVTGTDGISQFQSTTNVPATEDTNDIVLVPDNAPVTSAAGHTATFILPNDLDAFNAINAAFWIEINDDPLLGLSFAVKCQRWTRDVSSPISHFPYPILPTIIPIGRLEAIQGDGYSDSGPPDPHNLSNYQELFSHAINRYPASSGGIFPSHYLGNWTDQGLDGRYFWPGDEFQYDDGGANTWLLQFTGIAPAKLTGVPVGQPGVEIKWDNSF